MSVLKMKKFTDDDGGLTELTDIPFIHSKMARAGDDFIFDFKGVLSVTLDYLRELFKGYTPEAIAPHIKNINEEVDQVLARWVENQGKDPKIEFTSSSRIPQIKPTKPEKPVIVYHREEIKDAQFTPMRLVKRLGESLRGYIESAYPLSDPILVKARRNLLTEQSSRALLSQEPFIETTPKYASVADGYDGVGLPPHLCELFKHLSKTKTQASDSRNILYPGIYKHQAKAFRSFLVDKKDVIVATGTGSGKTECFLIPMLGKLYDEAHKNPKSFKKHGVRALILYPMNALVNDQLSRLRLLFGEQEVADAFKKLPSRRFPRFGMYTGRTVYPGVRTGTKDSLRVAPLLEYYLELERNNPELYEHLKSMGRVPAKDLKAFYNEQAITYSSKNRRNNHWPKRLLTGENDRELLTRQEMVKGAGCKPGHAPDILVTNYSMLEYMLMRPFERPIFDETKEWLKEEGTQFMLVLDEAHMYRGASGAEVAFLIRRLRARLGIDDQPDKLRVVATSASLGNDDKSLDHIKRFLADLVGKEPDDFVPITGTRENPTPVGVATAAETDLFASIDSELLSDTTHSGGLFELLKDVFAFYDVHPEDRHSEEAILAALHKALAGRPLVNLLIGKAATKATPLTTLAKEIFPCDDAEKQIKAMQSLLALGTLAREKKDEPGLVPTRVHAMFRGLHGLYACINPRCSGRQAEPGKKALLGKLFTTPRVTCDACESRVFELASCMQCGTPYLYAYTPEDRKSYEKPPTFLWGELGSSDYNVSRLELLPTKPKYAKYTHEIRVWLRTGHVHAQKVADENEVRCFFIPRNTKGLLDSSFNHCPMCQSTAQSNAKIRSFRTSGEDPFTALIETQFSEQPPQTKDERLPNRGRKVLVFSDGRQKAARLAPALEYSHSKDLFRQLLCIAASELGKIGVDATTDNLYKAVVYLCVDRGYTLFPGLEYTNDTFFSDYEDTLRSPEGDLKSFLSGVNLKPSHLFGEALFFEVTDNFKSLPSLALGTFEENKLITRGLFDDFPEVGLNDEARRILYRIWLRIQLERRCFLPDGVSVQTLRVGYTGPEGIDTTKNNNKDLIPTHFKNYLITILGEGEQENIEENNEESEENKDKNKNKNKEGPVDRVISWFEKILMKNRSFRPLDREYFISPNAFQIKLRLDEPWLCCSDCASIYVEALEATCPNCCGKLVEADPSYLDARNGFYRDQVRRAMDDKYLEPFGLTAAEHSAQLTGGMSDNDSAYNRVEEYELRFQDILLSDKDNIRIKPVIDVLSCTTTMEVGIDIGALTGVALRNVPPHVSNYQQRAGRAGRRGRSVASVITYAHGTSHDAHFFDYPAELISGDVRAPIVYVENQQILTRHLFAYLVQRYFHEVTEGESPKSTNLFDSLGSVREFLTETRTATYSKFQQWLKENEATLKSEIRCWVPTYFYGLDEEIKGVEDTISNIIETLIKSFNEVLPLEEIKDIESLDDIEREGLEKRLEDTLLDTLMDRALLPRYAFPTDVVSFWVSRRRQGGDRIGHRTFIYEPQRELKIALAEYAPGRTITIDKQLYQSAAIFSPFEPKPEATLARRRTYASCKVCNYVTLDAKKAQEVKCPNCGEVDSYTKSEFIRPAGFAPDINIQPKIDRGEVSKYSGSTDRARLEVQDPPNWKDVLYDGRLSLWPGHRQLVVVNKGIDDNGFHICPECGAAEPLDLRLHAEQKLVKKGVPVVHKHPFEYQRDCTGKAEGPFFLGYQFPTDALLLRLRAKEPVVLGSESNTALLSRAAQAALASLVESISLAASRELQIDEGELSGWWTPLEGAEKDEAQLYIYDLLPGGAGYARSVGNEIEKVLDATEKLLNSCDCEASCYRCIRHYGNNFIHSQLDRRLALALLRNIRQGEIPTVSESEKKRCLAPLFEYLKLKGYQTLEDSDFDGVKVPLAFKRSPIDQEWVWVDVFHPLVSSNLSPTEVGERANMKMLEYFPLNTYELLHDLPKAVDKLQLTN